MNAKIQQGGDPARFCSQLSSHLQEFKFIHGVFKELGAANLATILYPSDILCDQNGFCRTYQDSHSLYSDDSHLSDFAGTIIEPILIPIFELKK